MTSRMATVSPAVRWDIGAVAYCGFTWFGSPEVAKFLALSQLSSFALVVCWVTSWNKGRISWPALWLCAPLATGWYIQEASDSMVSPLLTYTLAPLLVLCVAYVTTCGVLWVGRIRGELPQK